MNRALRTGRRGLMAGLTGLTLSRAALAATNPALLNISRYVYVPSAVAPEVGIIDIDTNRLVGQLQTGIIAQQAVVSRAAATLIAIDGRSASATLVDVFAGSTRSVALPAPAQRLTVSANGQFVAATDMTGGTITVIDLAEGEVGQRISGLPPVRDTMFGERDTVLYVATERDGDIGVVDLASGVIARRIAAFPPGSAGIAALARTPDGRRLLALPQGGGPISLLDPAGDTPAGRLAAGTGTQGVFPSGAGNYLLVPDSAAATLEIFRTANPASPVSLPGAEAVVGVYTTWLDSVAFMPSIARRSVLVYDLDAMRHVGNISLRGTPVLGAVTADSRTLYLPVSDPPSVQVLDGETRTITAAIDLPHRPLAALIAGGSGLCH
jgi:DNA-binding beta-propeller fold protein YncE